MSYTYINQTGTYNTNKSKADGVNSVSMYIVNLLTGVCITVRIFPDEISESLQAEFEEVTPRGRSNPIYGYSTSGPRTLSYTLQLHDDYLPEGILTTVNHLRSLVYPSYNGGSISPPKCMVRVGENVKFVGICKEVSVNWMKPIRNGYYINAEVTLSFDEVCDTARGSAEMAKGDFTS